MSHRSNVATKQDSKNLIRNASLKMASDLKIMRNIRQNLALLEKNKT
jgi:hypothetical protein